MEQEESKDESQQVQTPDTSSDPSLAESSHEGADDTKNVSKGVNPAEMSDGARLAYEKARASLEEQGYVFEDDPQEKPDPSKMTDEERAAYYAKLEHQALTEVFADIRKQSSDSELVIPARWAEQGFVPEHMDDQSFVDLVFAYLDEHGQDEDPKKKEKHHYTDGWSAVGSSIDPAVRARKAKEAAEQAVKDADQSSDTTIDAADASSETAKNADSDANAKDADASVKTVAATAGVAVAATSTDADDTVRDAADTNSQSDETSSQAQDELSDNAESDASDEPHDPSNDPIRCCDVAVLEGAETMYLYSRDKMTDAYAKWAFLAKEDNKVTTFVTCTREDSRVYPRPLIYTSLMNDPFDFTEDEIFSIWQTVQESGAYPDIGSCDASNGDVYFFSTKYLSADQAQSLAEYYSVERPMSV
ncbi:MAG: hypothetical protein LKF61_05375 [Eggerthellaceae bacterium]|jgi:hypothetical protein|nr:hypothetical protein [Eggerthellaceae bacterium]MCH4220972.1 hypothetical protein [Eggerthellaceae bacterium]